jgi:indole-3-glycerol phosphate synthase
MGVLQTGTILDRIVAKKLAEVEKLKSLPRPGPPRERRSKNPGENFLRAVRDKEKKGRPIIAEIKRASPSAGVLRDPFLPAGIAKAYKQNGARAVSVITDQEFFQGSLEALIEVGDTVDLPLLRKDFIIDRVQVEDAAGAGAGAVLLIARILSDDLLKELYEMSASLSLAPLIEVHDKKDLERALALSPAPGLVGINNRDLSDFSVSVDRTLSLLPEIPEGVTIVSESGLSDPATLDRLMDEGVDAFLIGTALMKADDAGEALRRLVYE